MGHVIKSIQELILAFAVLLLLLVAGANESLAQDNSVAESLNLAKATASIRVDAHLKVLEDCSRALTFEKVEVLVENGAFKRSGHLGANFGYSTCAYWLKLSLHDDNAVSQHDWFLVVENPRVNSVDLYERTSKQVSALHSGGQLRISQRAVQSRYPAFSLGIVSRNTRTVYLRVLTTDVASFPVTMTQSAAFWHKSQREEMILGIYFGLLMLAALLNCFAFAHLKDPTYLAYVSTIVCYAGFQVAVNGVDIEYLWPNCPSLNAVAIPLSCGLCIASYAVFSWLFLGMSEHAPRMRALPVLLVAVGGLIVLMALAGRLSLAGYAGSLAAPAAVVSIGSISVVALVRGSPQATHFILAGSLQALGVLADGLHNLGFLPANFATTFGGQIGSALFVCILSLALTGRFATIQRNQVAAERVAAEFSRKTTEAKLQALQARINPHFLFNTLSTIAGLIREAPERAEAVVLKLAKLFRYTLDATEQRGRVQLTEELSIVRSYLEIEQARFGERLEFSITVEGDVDSVSLPGLTLQPLVENCVKHGLRPKLNGGRVQVIARVNAERCSITVHDDGVGMDLNRAHTGHGLSSVRERLKLAYGDAAQMKLLNQLGLRVDIDLPLRSTL